jgi:hypothetical protein
MLQRHVAQNEYRGDAGREFRRFFGETSRH